MLIPTVICHCVNIEIGSYDNQVSMKNPHAKTKPWVCIDTCMATVIGWLWHQGVVTGGCCCGHGELRPSVAVYPDSMLTMLDLGYEQFPDNPHAFYVDCLTDERVGAGCWVRIIPDPPLVQPLVQPDGPVWEQER